MNSAINQAKRPHPEGRISSATTQFLKWFPIVWMGASVVIVSVGLGVVLKSQDAPWFGAAVLISLLLIIVGAGTLLSRMFSRCVDDVVIKRDQFLVRKGNVNITLGKDEVESLTFSTWINPPIGKLKLRKKSELGETLHFFAPIGISSFSPNPKLKQLSDWVASAD